MWWEFAGIRPMDMAGLTVAQVESTQAAIRAAIKAREK